MIQIKCSFPLCSSGKQNERVMGQAGLAWWEGAGAEQWARDRLMTSGLETEALMGERSVRRHR